LRVRIENWIGEWKILAALAALLSLALLLPFVPGAEKRFQHQQRALDDARERIEAGEYEEASRGLRKYLLAWGESPTAAEAEYLLGESLEGEARENPGTTGRNIMTVSDQYRKAGHLGYDSARVERGLIRAANLLRDRGFHRAAAGLYRTQLISRRGYWEAHLDLARSLSLEARKDPDNAEALLKESRAQLAEYMKRAEGRDRIEALLLLSQLHWRQDQFAEMEKTALLAIPDVLDSRYLADFYLQWGMARSRLGQVPGALEVLPVARDLAQTGKVREAATYFEAELRLGELDGRGENLLEKLAREDSFLKPLVYLLRGKYWLETGGRDPFPMLKAGLEAIPNPQKFADFKPDLAGLFKVLSREARKSGDLGRFNTLLDLLEEYHRIYPDRIDYLVLTGELKMARGKKLSAEAGSMEQVDPIGADRIRRQANRLFYSAGKTFARVADHPGTTLESAEDAQLAAAEAFNEGRQYVQAAEWYRNHYHVRPVANRDSLFREGESLMRGKLYEADSLDEPSALRTFAEYLMEAGPTSPRTPQVMVYRARMLLELGKPLEASKGLAPLLREPQYNYDPREPEWAEALLLRGLAQAQMSENDSSTDARRRNARREASRLLHEYMERFSKALGPRDTPPAGVLEAGFALSRIATQEKRWDEATDRLVEMLRFSGEIPSSARMERDASLRRAHFLLGDLYLNRGKKAEALRAYEKAARKYATSEDRLWGLVGRARCLIRMGKREEAGKAVQIAKATYTSHPELFDEAMDGHGKTYWPAALRELEAELQEGITFNGR
jgi:tetratricopeptide (TPR) repeat protein